jgi:hypothetical protein
MPEPQGTRAAGSSLEASSGFLAPSPELEGQAGADAPRLSPAAKRIVPWLCGTALFMELLDATIVNTAVPTMATALEVAPLSLKTVLTSYTLSLAVFIPISG